MQELDNMLNFKMYKKVILVQISKSSTTSKALHGTMLMGYMECSCYEPPNMKQHHLIIN